MAELRNISCISLSIQPMRREKNLKYKTFLCATRLERKQINDACIYYLMFSFIKCYHLRLQTVLLECLIIISI